MSNLPYPLTRDSRLAMDRAGRIAEQNKQGSIDSLMLLLALLQLPNSQAQAVLRSLNVKVDTLAARISATIKLETQQAVLLSGTKINLKSECVSVLDASFAEAKQTGLNTIDELTMLLGMAQSPESRAGQILSQYVVTDEQVREQIKIIKEKPAPKKPILAMPKVQTRGMRQGISPVFVCLALFTVVTACLLWLGVGNNPRALLIVFIMLGWIVSVALHEFGHAIVAYWGGDESVEEKGYLTLNPLKYSNPLLSIGLPLFFLLIGGIGLPGGAVYINIHALRKPLYRALVSGAGPLANLLFTILLILPFGAAPYSLFFWSAPDEFLMAIAFLGFLQVTAIIINLLPIPGLDGFGILEPFLPRGVVEFSGFIRPFGFLVLYLFVFVDSPISDFFWSTVWGVTELFSFNFAYYANEGLKLFLGR